MENGKNEKLTCNDKKDYLLIKTQFKFISRKL